MVRCCVRLSVVCLLTVTFVLWLKGSKGIKQKQRIVVTKFAEHLSYHLRCRCLYGGSDSRNLKVLSLERKNDGVVDDKSGEEQKSGLHRDKTDDEEDHTLPDLSHLLTSSHVTPSWMTSYSASSSHSTQASKNRSSSSTSSSSTSVNCESTLSRLLYSRAIISVDVLSVDDVLIAQSQLGNRHSSGY